MLAVQEYLRSGKTLDHLVSDFAIRVTEHPGDEPLVILNYHQIDSKPKAHPIVRECRGLVLERDSWNLVARSFPRFFNWGEFPEEQAKFNFRGSAITAKEDGSLVLFYCYDSKWRCNTRGSFGNEYIHDTDKTWQQYIMESLGVRDLSELALDKNLTYVCEFCSPLTKVVRKYDVPRMYCITTFEGEHELPDCETRALIPHAFFTEVYAYWFGGMEEIVQWLNDVGREDPAFEGVVVRSARDNVRWKIKSPTYLALHRMADRAHLFSANNLLPFALTGETSELLRYYPEVEKRLTEICDQVTAHWNKLSALWVDTLYIKDQKEFALAVVGKTPFSGLLFEARKRGIDYLPAFAALWQASGDQILKHLK